MSKYLLTRSFEKADGSHGHVGLSEEFVRSVGFHKLLHAMPGLPSANGELHRIAQDFAISRQPLNPLQGCVGAVDGICIEMQKHADEYDSRNFYCRKGIYAIPAQAVLDAKYRFLYLSAKCARSTSDAIAWETSSPGMRLRREHLTLLG
jgi:hypothetical protein